MGPVVVPLLGAPVLSVGGGCLVERLGESNQQTIFGGVELVVPTNWTVVFQGESIFGGYSDETLAPAAGNLQGAPNKTLIVRGRSIFGGVSVKN